MISTANQMRRVVQRVIASLVAGDFEHVESLCRGQRLSAAEMANVIKNYGRQLISPPDEAYESMDVVEVTDSHPRRWSINIPLWTKEEGRSDLTLEVTLTNSPQGWDVAVDDIHVL